MSPVVDLLGLRILTDQTTVIIELKSASDLLVTGTLKSVERFLSLSGLLIARVIVMQVSGYQAERCPGKAGHPVRVRKPIGNRNLEKSSVHAFTVSVLLVGRHWETYAIVGSTIYRRKQTE